MGEGTNPMMDTNDAYEIETVDAVVIDEADDTDARVEQLAAEIDETRGDLTETVQAIGEKLEPSNVARQATETVKQAATGKVEQMAMGAQETWRDVRSGDTGSIVDTVKSNPIPAGMVAIGLGMLLMNRGATAQRSSARTRFAGSYGGSNGGYDAGRPASWESQAWDDRGERSATDRIGSAVAGVGSSVSGAASDAGDTVGRVAGQAGDAVGQVVDTIGQTASTIPQQAGQVVEQGSSQIRRMIDENPLGAGVVALAAGAAIGMLLPTTKVERRTLGEARDHVVERAESTVNQALDHVEDQAAQGSEAPQG